MRILFITSTRLGDAVLSTGILRYLLQQNPASSVTVACGPAARELFTAVPGLERIIVLDKMLLSLHWLYLWANCVGRIWDVVVDLRNAPLTFIIPTKKAYRLFRSRAPGHHIKALAAILKIEKIVPSPYIWTTKENKNDAIRIVPDGTPVLAVGPTANWRAKQWRAERFIELIHRLTRPDSILPDARVLILGREDERPTALAIVESIPKHRCLDLIGRVDLLTAFACLQRSSLYIGNDSGLMHLAAASGIPTLGLFGPSPEDRYAPWGPSCSVVRGEVKFDEIFPENFNHRETKTLMDGLSVTTVEKQVLELWERVQKDLI